MTPTPLVLMYHGIATVPQAADPHNLFVPADTFRAQLVSLRAAGFTPVDLDGYLAARSAPSPQAAHQVLITLDDGYISTLEAAAPVLEQEGFPAVCFVSAGLLGETSYGGAHHAFDLMDAEQVRALPEHGVDIGVHGWDHQMMKGATVETLKQHTEDAGAALSALVGKPFSTFAYPYGFHDHAARAAVKDAGYTVGFATHDGAGPMAVPRVDINTTDTPRSFALKLHRWYPAARRTLGTVAPVRSFAHRLIGSADRSLRNDGHSV